jgi:heterodisulfide reductase subunit A
LVPSNTALSKLLGVDVDKDGFFLGAHEKLRPLELKKDGIFVCGTASGPKDISESISQAIGAAFKALEILSKEILRVKTVISEVDEEKCIGCGACVDLCPYGAARIEEEKAKIIDILCKGCGSCVVGCPVRAINVHHFKDEHYMMQIAELLA